MGGIIYQRNNNQLLSYANFKEFEKESETV